MTWETEFCREAAAECTSAASLASDPQNKKKLEIRAGEWMRLAYNDNETQSLGAHSTPTESSSSK
jgi:hypothetical protein